MTKATAPMAGIFVASLVSGPLFVISAALAMLYAKLPHPIVLGIEDIGPFFAIGLIAIPVGLVIGFVPNLIGATLMVHAGAASELARLPLLWMLAGAAAGASAAFGFGADPDAFFALTATSTTCALICRCFADWSE